ncbi:MAG: porin family protein [Bradyrhizobium sp.]|nr:porin family protein [Bradyrhizobium sp.]
MKSVLTAATLAILASTAAQSADMAARPLTKAPVVDRLYSWTGLYVGGTAGYGWGRTRQIDDTRSSPEFDYEGFVGGGTLGYNWQAGAVVLGFETDISYADIKGAIADGPGWGCGFPTTSCHNEVQWFGTARGRLGYALDRFLPYITGGLAYGRVYGDFTSCSLQCIESTRTGWTAGAGLEWAFASSWSAKVEYLRVDLGEFSVTSGGNTLGVVTTFDVVRAGINYKFDWGGAPLVAKY